MNLKYKFFVVLFIMLIHPMKSKAENLEVAILAGGCFWCIEKDFDQVDGVIDTLVGYTGGELPNPTYKQVSKGETGHIEALKITFDTDIISYGKLLDIFWRSVDPTDSEGQFCDRGQSYITSIFATTDSQFKKAESSKSKLIRLKILDQSIVTPIRRLVEFYPAESYHRDYYKKNPVRYNFYRFKCGRDKRVNALWGEEAYIGIKKK